MQKYEVKIFLMYIFKNTHVIKTYLQRDDRTLRPLSAIRCNHVLIKDVQKWPHTCTHAERWYKFDHATSTYATWIILMLTVL